MKLQNYLALCTATLVLCGCGKTDTSSGNPGQGILRIGLEHDPSVITTLSKASPVIDVSRFTVDILKDNIITNRYSPIGTTVKEVTLNEGEYTVNAYSEPFETPKFDTPVYGDSKIVTVNKGPATPLELVCTQTNAGLTIAYSDSFKAQYTSYSTLVNHRSGSLDYVGANATRTGYFPVGEATLVITAGNTTYERTLILEARHLYNVTIDQGGPDVSGGISMNISVSTSVITEDVTLTLPSTGDSGGGTRSDIYLETVGTENLVSAVNIAVFSEWANPDISYTATRGNITARSPDTPDYPGASPAAYLQFSNPSTLSISGIDCSGYRNIELTFGCKSGTGYFDPDIFGVAVYNGSTRIPLTYTREMDGQWRIATAEGTIPAASSLTIEFSCEANGYKLDDIKLTGVK